LIGIVVDLSIVLDLRFSSFPLLIWMDGVTRHFSNGGGRDAISFVPIFLWLIVVMVGSPLVS
jgi:hypothetical protein